MRQTLLYESPFRLRRRRDPEPDWGPEMTSEIALAKDGPLAASGPGDLTRWMAVPWQTDTSSCLSRYKHDVDGYLPTFWPARVPNDVLDLESYQAVMNDEHQPRKAAARIPEPGEVAARSAWIWRRQPHPHQCVHPAVGSRRGGNAAAGTGGRRTISRGVLGRARPCALR